MKNNLFFAIVLFLSCSYVVHAQDALNIENEYKEQKHALYADIGGWAFWYSVNYEYLVSLSTKSRIGFGAGVSILPSTLTAGALSANYLLGKTHNLELGVSVGSFIPDSKLMFSARTGYRYSRNNGFLFRAGVSPNLLRITDGPYDYGQILLPWPYLSFGYSFC